MFRLTVARKMFLIIVSTTTLVTLAGFTFLHMVQNMQLQTPNQPFKSWQYTALIQPLQQNNLAVEEVLDFSSLTAFCDNNTVHQITDQNQKYGAVIVRKLTITDLNGDPVWQCPHQIKQGNQFMVLPIKSRDDLADALSGQYNVGVELLDEHQYQIIKPIENGDDQVIGTLVSEQEWQIQPLENKWFYEFGVYLNNMAGFALINLLWILPSAFILAWLLTRGINRQLKHVLNVIEQWSGGNLDARIQTKGDDQVAQSLNRLNKLAQDFQNTLQETSLFAETRERQRIAAELHDTVKQLLFANNLQLAAAQKAELDDVARDMVASAIDNNRNAFSQINQLIDTLKPLDFIGEGFWPSVRDYVNKWSENQQVELSISVQEIALNAEQSHVLYRAIQESLQNIQKHSQANQVDIQFIEKDGQCELIVKDNGTATKEKMTFGQGLNLMAQRVEVIGGKVTFSANQGGELTLCFPINFGKEIIND